MTPEKAARKRDELREAALKFDEAIAAADQIGSKRGTVWRMPRRSCGATASRCSRDCPTTSERCSRRASVRQTLGDGGDRESHRPRSSTFAHIDPAIKGTWGAYDLEWIREMWLRGLQRRTRWRRETGGGTILMDADNGFLLSPELRALRDQVGKIIRDEIIPIEARSIPTPPKFPKKTTGGSRARFRPPACGAWARRANTAAAGSAPSTCAC